MKTWLSLLKKEFKLTQSFILGGWFLLTVVGALLVYVTYRYDGNAGVAFSMLLIFPHLLYLLLYMLRSLSTEWNHTAHLWLNLPQSGWVLLGAKVATGFLAMTVSLFIASGFCYWTLILLLKGVPPELGAQILQPLWQYGWYFFIGFLFIALNIGMWAATASIIANYLKRFINRGRWIISIGLIIGVSYLISLVQQTAVYSRLTQWSLINISTSSPINEVLMAISMRTGDVMFELLIAVFLFVFCGWLLDNKIEV